MDEDRGRGQIRIRDSRGDDDAFLNRVADRLRPGETSSPRDPELVRRYFAELSGSRLLSEPGSVAFVATIAEHPVGLIALHPDTDYFTGHPRAYVDVLVVASEAEGRGIGRSLLAHAEAWARRHEYREVVLDVFVTNESAVAFYERLGYRPDHIRMAKPLD